MIVTDRQPLWTGSPVMVDVIDRYIVTLRQHEVFVFGSNSTGFHGGGGAGIACRGDADHRTWRTDKVFTAMREAPAAAEVRRGLWAVFGVARGHQVGTTGQSYAVETIERPGRQYRRGTPLRTVYAQLRELVAFANAHPELEFVVTPLGERLSGWLRSEMALLWQTLHERTIGGIPLSFRFIRLSHSSDHSLT